MRFLLRLKRFWESLRFRKRWRDIYRNAVPLDAGKGIFLSVCPPDDMRTTADCFIRVWKRIPKPIRDELQAHWRRLQISWDARNTGIPLHIPVITVGRGDEMLSAFGKIIGTAIRTQPRYDAQNSMESTQRLFSGTFLRLWTETADPSDD